MVEVKEEYSDMETAAADQIQDAQENFTEEELDKMGAFLLKWRKPAGFKKFCRWVIGYHQGKE